MNDLINAVRPCPACKRPCTTRISRPRVPLESWCACCDTPLPGYRLASGSGAVYEVIEASADYVTMRRIDRGHDDLSRWHIKSLFCDLNTGGRQVEWTVEEILAREG